MAGYFAVPDSPDHDVQGMVQHFTVGGSNGALVDETGDGPAVPSRSVSERVRRVGHLPPHGMSETTGGVQKCDLTVASDGGVFSFGGQQFCGSTGAIALNKPVVGMAMAPDNGGYWLVAADGGVFTYGAAQFYGSTGAIHLNQPIVGMADPRRAGGTGSRRPTGAYSPSGMPGSTARARHRAQCPSSAWPHW